MTPPVRCAYCYESAEKADRTVRMTDVCKWPVCSLCESRIRNGLVHYVPSNGTEFCVFKGRCEKCRHFTGEIYDVKVQACKWGVLDKLLNMQMSDSDSVHGWHDPADLDTKTCPATCRRFTDRNDPDGHFRDPPPPDCEGQMTFGEIDVPRERIPNQSPAGA